MDPINETLKLILSSTLSFSALVLAVIALVIGSYVTLLFQTIASIPQATLNAYTRTIKILVAVFIIGAFSCLLSFLSYLERTNTLDLCGVFKGHVFWVPLSLLLLIVVLLVWALLILVTKLPRRKITRE